MAYTTKSEQRFVNCTLSGPVEVYVKNNKIIRVLPLGYQTDDAPPWKLEARGQTFTRPNKAGISCWVRGASNMCIRKTGCCRR